jgi:P2 family phage contractile tail tube protein
MSFPRTIRNFNVFVDGRSYFGRGVEGTLPAVRVQTMAHRGAGMDGTIGIDVGLEAMSAEATFAEWDPELLKQIGNHRRMVFRPVARGENDVTVDAYIATVGGLFTVNEFGGLQPGNESRLQLTVDVRYYKLEVNGEVVQEIDLENAVRRIGGVDQNAELRRAMGL